MIRIISRTSTIAFFLLISGALVSQNLPYLYQDGEETKVDREAFSKYLNEHPFARREHMDKKQLKKLEKRDRPDLAWEQDYLRTMDPLTGMPMPERLWPIFRSLSNSSVPTAAPGSSTSNQWTERGPDNVGGRTRALAFDPSDNTHKKVWAGGVTGGLWVNNDITSSTSSWTPVGDMWSNIAITAIAFDPNNANTIYVGTGEGWGGAAQSGRGAGIWKSTNGGSTFSQLSSTTTFYYVNDLIVRSEGSSSVVYAAVANKFYKGQWHGNKLGLYRSTNGGSSWTQVMPNVSGNPYEPADIELAADNRIWIGTASNGFGNGGGTVLYSDNGTSWTVSTSVSGADRVELACAPSDSATVYGLVEKGNKVEEIIRTSNRGTTWLKSSTSSSLSEPADADNGIPNTDFSRGQAWYDLIAQVSPGNKDTVVVGGIDLFMSTNGGQTWKQISKWSNNNNLFNLTCSRVHADQHQIIFRPTKSNELIVGNDGGVYYCSDLKTSETSSRFSERNKSYRVTQYYAGAIHPGAGSNVMLAGAQDNGTQRYSTSGMNSTTEVRGGDGAYCFIDQTNGNYAIASYVYNTYRLSTNAGATFSSSNDLINDQNSGSFINPADYDNTQHILFSTKESNSIYRVKNVTTSSSPPVDSIVLTGFNGKATALTASPYGTTTSTLFIGNGSGKLFKITNAHSTSPTITNITGSSFPSSSISCIEIGATDNELLVTFSNYGVNSVWYSSNGGSSWVNKEGNLPDMPVRFALFNPRNRAEVILATEVGIWATSNIAATSPSWSASNQGMANVRVDMLQYRTSDSTVMASTHGRGVYTGRFVSPSSGPSVPVASFTNTATSICSGQTVTYTNTSSNSPTSVTWTFPGGTPSSSTSAGPVTVTYSTAGTFSAKLLVSNSAGADSTTKVNLVSVTTKVTPTASTIAPVCSNSPSFTLSNCTPTGGVYSGPGVSSGVFSPSSAGTGTKSIKYKLGSGQCADSVVFSIVVNAAPSVSFASVGPFCLSNPSQTLTQGSPSGGVYSGSGVSSGSFSPSTAGVGSHSLKYTYTNANACSDSASTTVTVVNSISVSTTTVPNQCANGPSLTLSNGSPSGGTYSGPGVSGSNLFFPDSAGVGVHTIKYKAGTGSCVDSTTFQITVDSVPLVSLAQVGPLCLSASPVTLMGSPAGGTYSGSGVSTNTFNPSTAGLGSHIVGYTYSDANSCIDSTTITVVVNNGTTLAFGSLPTVCESGSVFTLNQGTPAGGVYSGPGVVQDSVFNPSLAGSGVHTLTYTDSSACGAKSVTQTITVNSAPKLVVSADTGMCKGDSMMFSASGALTYSWSGATTLTNTTIANPTAFPTTTTRYYLVGRGANGCTATDSVLLTVYLDPAVSAGKDDTICLGDTFQLQASGASSYRWFPPTGLFSTTVSNPKGTLTSDQVYFVEGTDSNGCKAQDRVNVTVVSGVQVVLAPFSSVCLNDSAFALSGGTPAGGVYFGVGVVNNNTFNPALAGAGTHNIVYASAFSGACVTRDSQNIVVSGGPQIVWPQIGSSCEGDSIIQLGATPSGGVYSGPGISGGTFDPALAGFGTHEVSYSVSDAQGCKAIMKQLIAVRKGVDIDTIYGLNNVVKNKVYSYSVKALNGSAYDWSVVGGRVISKVANSATVRWGTGVSGEVKVTQTNPEGCQDSSKMQVAINVLGAEEFELGENSVKLYPNPAQKELNIDFNGILGSINVSILDGSGKRVYTEKREVNANEVLRISVESLPNGTYHLNVEHEGNRSNKAFLINK